MGVHLVLLQQILVNGTLVFFQLIRMHEPFQTFFAFKWVLVGVTGLNVPSQTRPLGVDFLAIRTDKGLRLLVRIDRVVGDLVGNLFMSSLVVVVVVNDGMVNGLHVGEQVLPPPEGLAALGATEGRLEDGVEFFVHF